MLLFPSGLVVSGRMDSLLPSSDILIAEAELWLDAPPRNRSGIFAYFCSNPEPVFWSTRRSPYSLPLLTQSQAKSRAASDLSYLNPSLKHVYFTDESEVVQIKCTVQNVGLISIHQNLVRCGGKQPEQAALMSQQDRLHQPKHNIFVSVSRLTSHASQHFQLVYIKLLNFIFPKGNLFDKNFIDSLVFQAMEPQNGKYKWQERGRDTFDLVLQVFV